MYIMCLFQEFYVLPNQKMYYGCTIFSLLTKWLYRPDLAQVLYLRDPSSNHLTMKKLPYLFKHESHLLFDLIKQYNIF